VSDGYDLARIVVLPTSQPLGHNMLYGVLPIHREAEGRLLAEKLLRTDTRPSDLHGKRSTARPDHGHD
jgi:hypothetical protein